MLMASISSTVVTPTAKQSAEPLISTARRSRSAASICFESSMPRGRKSRGRITAAATTGPASGAMPASSTPAIRVTPFSQRGPSPARRTARAARRRSCGRCPRGPSGGIMSPARRPGQSTLWRAALVVRSRLTLRACLDLDAQDLAVPPQQPDAHPLANGPALDDGAVEAAPLGDERVAHGLAVEGEALGRRPLPHRRERVEVADDALHHAPLAAPRRLDARLVLPPVPDGARDEEEGERDGDAQDHGAGGHPAPAANRERPRRPERDDGERGEPLAGVR